MVWFVRKPNKRAAIVAGAVVIGTTALTFPAGYFPYCASPAGGRRHGAGGSCCSTGPANLAGSPGAAGRTPLPLTAYAWGVSCHAAGRFHRGGGLSFSLCSRSPWRARQKPLIAGIACNGAALHSVVIPPNDSGKRPVAYLPAGRHFFKETSYETIYPLGVEGESQKEAQGSKSIPRTKQMVSGRCRCRRFADQLELG